MFSTNYKNDKNKILLFSKDFTAGFLSKAIVQTIQSPNNVGMLQRTFQPYFMSQQRKGWTNFYVRYIMKNGILSLWENNLKYIVCRTPTYSIGLNFALNDYFKSIIFKDSKTTIEFVDDKHLYKQFVFGNFIAGSMSGFITSLIITPISNCIFYETNQVNEPKKFKSNLNLIYKKKDFAGLFNLSGINSVLYFIYFGCLFGGYDTAKYYFLSSDPNNNNNNNSNFLKSWAIAHFVTVLSSYASFPFETIRLRMVLQTGRKDKLYNSSFDCFKKIIKREGVSSLYKNMFSRCNIGITNSLYLVLFDKIQKHLINL